MKHSKARSARQPKLEAPGVVLNRGTKATLPRSFLGIATSSSAMLFCARKPGCFTLRPGVNMSASLETFRESIRSDSQSALVQRLVNCRANPKYSEHARMVEQELNARYPGWDKPRTRRGGKRATVAKFKERTAQFESARDAYIWLVERFADAVPSLFTDLRLETIGYFAIGRRRTPEQRAQRNYFAKTARNLFRRSPSLADDSSNYRRLSNGWFANLNVNTRENFEILCRLSAVAKLTHGADWDWEVLDPTEELHTVRQRTIAAEKLQREVEEWIREAFAS